MAEKLVNSFLLGADPELILLDPPSLVNAERLYRNKSLLFGFDHGGFVVEPHPTPSFSARTVCKNIKKSMDVLANRYPEYRFRAGAYYSDPKNRDVTLGGHVHLDLKDLSKEQVLAMDNFYSSMHHLDILPKVENDKRFTAGMYGRKGDIRREHGHVEYRAMPSWLFSHRTSMLCITGIKLCAVAPETIGGQFTSIKAVQNWLEDFKGKDDDVDWILDRGYFATKLEAKPDNNLKAIWKVNPDLAKGWDEEIDALKKAEKPEGIVRPLDMHALRDRIRGGGDLLTAEEQAEAIRRAANGSMIANTVLGMDAQIRNVRDQHLINQMRNQVDQARQNLLNDQNFLNNVQPL